MQEEVIRTISGVYFVYDDGENRLTRSIVIVELVDSRLCVSAPAASRERRRH